MLRNMPPHWRREGMTTTLVRCDGLEIRLELLFELRGDVQWKIWMPAPEDKYNQVRKGRDYPKHLLEVRKAEPAIDAMKHCDETYPLEAWRGADAMSYWLKRELGETSSNYVTSNVAVESVFYPTPSEGGTWSGTDPVSVKIKVK